MGNKEFKDIAKANWFNRAPWAYFASYVMHYNRYFLDEHCKTLLGDIKDMLTKKTYGKGHIFFRARLGYKQLDLAKSNPYLSFNKEDMGVPNIKETKNGRANPNGIPYLYLSTDVKTAACEVKPVLRQPVSVAKITLLSDVNVADFSCEEEEIMTPHDKKRLTVEERQKITRCFVTQSFSWPILPNEEILAYVPTQIISEYLKQNGYDGILYKSAVGPKYNVVIFDSQKARCLDDKDIVVTYAKKVNYKFNPSRL